MPRIVLAFFTAAAIYLVVGMAWGIQMAATNNHIMSPAHAHLNLIGFVVQSIMGAFYGLAGPRPSHRMAWTSFALINIGVILLIPALALMLDGSTDPVVVTLLKFSPMMILVATLMFLANVVRAWKMKAA